MIRAEALSCSDGTTTSPLTTETIPNGGVPALSITKSTLRVTDSGLVDRSGGFEAVGDHIFYTFTVENTGALALVNPVVITDANLPGPLTCFEASGADPDFRPGESVTCETDAALAYTVTQDDLDAGQVLNEEADS